MPGTRWAHVDLTKLRHDAKNFCAYWGKTHLVERIDEFTAARRSAIW